MLRNDSNEIVCYEAAFLLGRMGYLACVPHLERATLGDSSMFVRYEATIAHGVVGTGGLRSLDEGPVGSRRPVVGSAVLALSNIVFMKKLSRTKSLSS